MKIDIIQLILLTITVGGIAYTVIVNRAILRNEVKHIREWLEKLEQRIGRIENKLFRK